MELAIDHLNQGMWLGQFNQLKSFLQLKTYLKTKLKTATKANLVILSFLQM